MSNQLRDLRSTDIGWGGKVNQSVASTYYHMYYIV